MDSKDTTIANLEETIKRMHAERADIARERKWKNRFLITTLTLLTVVAVNFIRPNDLEKQYAELEAKFNEQSLVLDEAIGQYNTLFGACSAQAAVMKDAIKLLDEADKIIAECVKDPAISAPPVIIEQTI